ncbi:hypothetical protein PAHAL_3G051100 [Panicum hallii]|uniref:Xylanase inhibitor C-terminal domain-containing protein n=1 Tax=Panicum hallii TaxID=206008 RepID=A0A2S3H6E8_9POAL|nr:hypothetical protein PAHAL_3G051100 [Panicum hallii]
MILFKLTLLFLILQKLLCASNMYSTASLHRGGSIRLSRDATIWIVGSLKLSFRITERGSSLCIVGKIEDAYIRTVFTNDLVVNLTDRYSSPIFLTPEGCRMRRGYP